MGKKTKAPEYVEATYDTGDLFGTSTNTKKGTTYSPAGWMSETMGTVGNNINSTLSNMLSNDFANDANFQAYQDQFNKIAEENYDASVLSNLANRGLMRSTGLQTATNNFNEALLDNTTNLFDDYYNRQSNNLANMLNTSNTLFDYMTGINNGAKTDANTVNSFNLGQYKLNNSGGGLDIGNMVGGIGSLGLAGFNLYNKLKGGE